jgi:hypothetical protein
MATFGEGFKGLKYLFKNKVSRFILVKFETCLGKY